MTFFLLCFALACQDFDPGLVIAKVNDAEITAGEAMFLMNNRIGDRKLDESQQAKLQAESLEQLIRRRLVHQQLEQDGLAAGTELVRYRIEQFKKRLRAAGQTLEQHLKEKQLTEEAFFFEKQWQISWTNYTTKQLNESTAREFFDQRRNQFDGTQIAVAHIVKLFPPSVDDRRKFTEGATKDLEQIREQILTGKIKWEESAKAESDAPSKDHGGSLGFIGFDGPMAPDFNRAAFQLKIGEISLPVTTQFGVHLIKCMDIQPGKMGFQDASRNVHERLMDHRFNELAERQRKTATITYSDHWPHYVNGFLVRAKPLR